MPRRRDRDPDRRPGPPRPAIGTADLARLILRLLEAEAGTSPIAFAKAHRRVDQHDPQAIRCALNAMSAAGLVRRRSDGRPAMTGAGQAFCDMAWDRGDWTAAKVHVLTMTSGLDLGDLLEGLRWLHGAWCVDVTN